MSIMLLGLAVVAAIVTMIGWSRGRGRQTDLGFVSSNGSLNIGFRRRRIGTGECIGVRVRFLGSLTVIGRPFPLCSTEVTQVRIASGHSLTGLSRPSSAYNSPMSL